MRPTNGRAPVPPPPTPPPTPWPPVGRWLVHLGRRRRWRELVSANSRQAGARVPRRRKPSDSTFNSGRRRRRRHPQSIGGRYLFDLDFFLSPAGRPARHARPRAGGRISALAARRAPAMRPARPAAGNSKLIIKIIICWKRRCREADWRAPDRAPALGICRQDAPRAWGLARCPLAAAGLTLFVCLLIRERAPSGLQ